MGGLEDGTIKKEHMLVIGICTTYQTQRIVRDHPSRDANGLRARGVSHLLCRQHLLTDLEQMGAREACAVWCMMLLAEIILGERTLRIPATHTEVCRGELTGDAMVTKKYQL